MCVDAVYTWVDGSNDSFQCKLSFYVKKTISSELANESVARTRFASSFELFYSIQLLRKNASWIRKIFVIYDGEVPQWASDDFIKYHNVIFVSHSEIFGLDSTFLPTFSSRSIEAQVSRVPGISEKFLYLNDDFFIVSKVSLEDFYDRGKIIVRGCVGIKNYFLDRVFRLFTLQRFFLPGLIGRRPEISKTKFFYLSVAHCPFPLRKKEFDIIIDNDMKTEISSYRFRGKNQIWPIGHFYNVLLKQKKIFIKRRDWVYIDCRLHSLPIIKKALNRSEKYKFVCIQSLDCASVDVSSAVRKYLEGLILSP